MKRIAFELDRPAIDRGRNQRDRAGAARHRRCVVQKFSRNRPLRALGEWNEMHFRSSTTRQSDAGQGHRRAHQLHETAARPFFVAI